MTNARAFHLVGETNAGGYHLFSAVTDGLLMTGRSLLMAVWPQKLPGPCFITAHHWKDFKLPSSVLLEK